MTSHYVSEKDRYVVSLIVGYGDGDGVSSPEEAAFYALELTRDGGCSGTQWSVLDRVTGETRMLEQSDFDGDSDEEPDDDE